MLHDTVERKFIDTINVSGWEVLSDDGWHDISHINKTIAYEVYRIRLANGFVIECADTHIFIDSEGGEVFAKDSLGVFLKTTDGVSSVASVEATGVFEEMYDLTVGGANHTYYTNNILSHNTTTSSIILLHYAIFNERKFVGILANKKKASFEVLYRIKAMYELLPHWMQVGVIKWNEGDIELGNRTKIVAEATSASSFRGKSVHFLYLDEAAFIPNNIAEAFFASVYPTIAASKTSKVLMTSTPKGLNYFYKYWTDATEGRGEFKPFSIQWNDVPGRDEKFKADIIETMGQAFWDQEFACEFLGSQGSLISSNALRTLTPRDPIRHSNNLKVWEHPRQDRLYFMGVDVSRGTGGDYSVIQVLDISALPFRQVAVYRSNLTSHLMMPRIIAEIGRQYNNAFCLIEINDIGEAVADALHFDEEYEGILTTGEQKRRITLGGWKNSKNGLRTTTSTKNIGCGALKALVENQKIILQDFETINELSNFVAKGKSYQAESGYHDDLVMALVVFAWATGQEYFKDVSDSDFKKRFLEEREATMMEELAPLGYFDNGIDDDESGWEAIQNF